MILKVEIDGKSGWTLYDGVTSVRYDRAVQFTRDGDGYVDDIYSSYLSDEQLRKEAASPDPIIMIPEKRRDLRNVDIRSIPRRIPSIGTTPSDVDEYATLILCQRGDYELSIVLDNSNSAFILNDEGKTIERIL